MDYIVRGVAKSQIRLSDLHFPFHIKDIGMATHSSILAWRIPWTEEPGGATVHGVAKSQTRLSD